MSTIWPDEAEHDLEFFQTVADRAVYFALGFPISVKHVQLGIDKGDLKLQKLRQGLLRREQSTLKYALRIIHVPVPMTQRQENIKQRQAKRKAARVAEEELQAVHMAQTVLSKCFMIVYHCIIENERNQLYVADCFYKLLKHLNVQPMAGKCVTVMLSKSMDVQETKVGAREIQKFVDNLRSSRMNSMYLQLLRAGLLLVRRPRC